MDPGFLYVVSSASLDEELDTLLDELTRERDQLIAELNTLLNLPSLIKKEQILAKDAEHKLAKLTPKLALAAFEKRDGSNMSSRLQKPSPDSRAP